MANRQVSKSGLIPAKDFASVLGFLDECEKACLVKIPPYVSPPYLVLTRDIDQYGYVSFDGNYYWVPGTSRGEAKVLQYSKTIKIYQARKLLVEYSLPAKAVSVIGPVYLPAIKQVLISCYAYYFPPFKERNSK